MRLVSIVIVNFNGDGFLLECLESVFIQTHRNFEVILVDNNSTDGSVSSVTKRYPEIKIIKNKFNYGYAGGANIGIKNSRGDYVVVLNTDVVVSENWLENLARTMENDGAIGACSSFLLSSVNRNIIDTLGIKDLGRDLDAVQYGRGQSRREFKNGIEIFSVSGAAACYRKKALENAGYFDEAYFGYWEDCDISWRMRLKGWKCVVSSRAVAFHVKNASFNDIKKRVFLGNRNRWRTLLKNCGFSTLLKSMPFILCNEYKWLIYAVSNGDLSPLKARIEILKTLPEILSKRRTVQRKRTVNESALSREYFLKR